MSIFIVKVTSDKYGRVSATDPVDTAVPGLQDPVNIAVSALQPDVVTDRLQLTLSSVGIEWVARAW